jgi:hypothetical protein
MKRSTFLGGVVLGFALSVLGACAVPALGGGGDSWTDGSDPGAGPWGSSGGATSQPTTGELTEGTSSAPTEAPPSSEPLRSWDGGVVDAPVGGSVTENAGTGRDLGPSQTGRMRIIELYQAVLDERDALADEVATLSAALEKAHELLDRSEANGLSLANRVATMQVETEQLMGESRDLAARLTTAQIRRLEAEKMLLEARIEWHRQQEANPAVSAAGEAGESRRVAKGDRP